MVPSSKAPGIVRGTAASRSRSARSSSSRAARALAGAIVFSSASNATGLMHGTTIASASTLCAAISYALMVARRTYYAVDTVIGAVENETVELVTAVGDSAAEFA